MIWVKILHQRVHDQLRRNVFDTHRHTMPSSRLASPLCSTAGVDMASDFAFDGQMGGTWHTNNYQRLQVASQQWSWLRRNWAENFGTRFVRLWHFRRVNNFLHVPEPMDRCHSFGKDTIFFGDCQLSRIPGVSVVTLKNVRAISMTWNYPKW